MTRKLVNMTLGVVITAPSSREDNLRRTIEHLSRADPSPDFLVVVGDGWSPPVVEARFDSTFIEIIEIPKHAPGQEQPRNVGVRVLREACPDATHVWFLDSDLIFKPNVLEAFERAYGEDPITEIVTVLRREYVPDVGDPETVTETTHVDRTTRTGPENLERVLLGPYEWLAPDVFECQDDLHTDIRWASFNEHGPGVALVNDLGAALGCFGGNLLWPIDRFVDVGGFHPELAHGRCEDGELGLRAAAAGVPITLVKDARAWHVAHQVDTQWALTSNARDVPMLNAMHPEVQQHGYLLTEADGARFDFACTWDGCDLVMNCHDAWNHHAQHRSGEHFTYNDPASVRRA